MSEFSALVHLVRNPWPRTFPDVLLVASLKDAAAAARRQMQRWEVAGEIEEGRGSFAAVLLDPTRPRSAQTLMERVMAIIMIGPDARKYVANGASKADAHDRHNMNMGQLVGTDNHLLADGEFGWGNSAEYRRAIGGGSGLSVRQDGELVELMLRVLVDAVRAFRKSWLWQQREQKPEAGHRWFDPDDQPGVLYANVIGLTKLESTTSAVA
jgi:hypothetical protein